VEWISIQGQSIIASTHKRNGGWERDTVGRNKAKRWVLVQVKGKRRHQLTSRIGERSKTLCKAGITQLSVLPTPWDVLSL
jgi:IS30 family transposase